MFGLGQLVCVTVCWFSVVEHCSLLCVFVDFVSIVCMVSLFCSVIIGAQLLFVYFKLKNLRKILGAHKCVQNFVHNDMHVLDFVLDFNLYRSFVFTKTYQLHLID